MTEHYCEEHQCKFYRNEKDGKVWYSHKIKGGEGYCNEPKEKQQEPEPKEATIKPEPTPKPKPVEELSHGKSKSFALSYAKDIACSLIRTGKEVSTTKVIEIAKAFENYLDGKEVSKGSDLVEAAKKMGAKEIKKEESTTK